MYLNLDNRRDPRGLRPVGCPSAIRLECGDSRERPVAEERLAAYPVERNGLEPARVGAVGSVVAHDPNAAFRHDVGHRHGSGLTRLAVGIGLIDCLLYTSDAA